MVVLNGEDMDYLAFRVSTRTRNWTEFVCIKGGVYFDAESFTKHVLYKTIEILEEGRKKDTTVTAKDGTVYRNIGEYIDAD